MPHSVSPITDSFFSKHVRLEFPPNHIVVAANSIPVGVYYVSKGLVKQYALTSDGHDVIMNIYRPGSFFPMIPVFTQGMNNYFFETIEKSVLFRAPTDTTLKFLKSNPDVLFDLVRRVYIGMDALMQQTTYNVVGDTRKKIIACLIQLGKRFGSVSESSVVISQQFTHKEIGLMAGSSRESVTRTLSQLEAQKFITIDKKTITINHMEKFSAQLSA